MAPTWSRPVYSTSGGRRCPECGRAIQGKRCDCRKKKQEPQVPADGILRLRREKKGRGGKIVTTISGAPSHEVKELGKSLRQACGTGGTVKQGVIELQGDHLSKLLEILRERGYKAVQAGA